MFPLSSAHLLLIYLAANGGVLLVLAVGILLSPRDKDAEPARQRARFVGRRSGGWGGGRPARRAVSAGGTAARQ